MGTPAPNHDLKRFTRPPEGKNQEISLRFRGIMASPYYIGTSSWVYPHWKARFYASGLNASRSLLEEKPPYVYFNNDWNAHAVHNAMRLRELLPA